MLFVAQGQAKREGDRQTQIETEGLKGALCVLECQDEFPGLQGEMKGFSVKMMAIMAHLPPFLKQSTVLWRHLNVEL